MPISRQDQIRMERAHVLAWPAQNTAVIDGWLWRSSGGASQRANSVSTIEFSGTDTATAIESVEARYHAAAMPARFHTYDQTAPAGLATQLQERGYSESEATMTMFKQLEPTTAPPGVESRDHAWDEWCEVYLGAITESRRAVNRKILRAVPRPSRFFACHHNGRIISTALCVIGFACAVAECVATRAEARQTGGARTVMAALLSWAADQNADIAGLQVTQSNAPAINLYQSLGFTVGATNRFWSNYPT